ncbi:MerR family transcriptional regulator [Pendulispora albinea]|uniref:MerR family transcriptional regulator n=1 Tax=Pendulispora albinea TaxID=2741071 RepID=A0ABZ2M2I1_9BACT
MYKIGQLARLAHISVRALHHYDDIDLVRPSGRSESGYRLYTERDLERLQQVLFFRELGFPLERIARILADPTFDRRAALIEQRARLTADAERTRALIELVDRTLSTMDEGAPMKPEDMFEGFDPSKYEEEAKARWGHTEAYAQSLERARSYGQADWQTIHAEAAATTRAFAELFQSGVSSGDPRAMDLAEQHRQHIDRWFYACSYAMHVGLGRMYVADARFAASYEKYAAGLAQFIADAIRFNASRYGEACE